MECRFEMLKSKGALQMAEIVADYKVIHIDDEDYHRIGAYKWKAIDNVAGRVGRRDPHSGRIIGLAATLIGKRPGPTKRLSFHDKNLRNFSKSNIFWNSDCIECGKPVEGLTSCCNFCLADFRIDIRSRVKRPSPSYRYSYRTVDE
jgi:hypothetical protein